MEDRRRISAGVVVFLPSSLLYLLTTGQHPFWLDSAEFSAVAREGGLAHPPGTPLYTLLASLATLLPVGAVPFRVHLLNALLGGLSATLLYFVCLRVATAAGGQEEGSPPTPKPLHLVAAAAVAIASAFSPAIWFQSVRAEVYALNSAICLGMVLLAMAWAREPERRRFPLAMGLAAGLGMANHHFLALLAGTACLLWLLAQRGVRRQLLSGRGWKPAAWAAAFAFAGLLAYAYLPVRAAQGWHLWGDAGSPSGFLSMVSARAFHLSVTEMPRAPVGVAALVILEKWIDLLGLPLFLAGFAGVAVLAARRRTEAALLLLLVAAGVVSKAIMYLDVENPDDHAYFLVGLQALSASSLGLFGLIRPERGRSPPGPSASLGTGCPGSEAGPPTGDLRLPARVVAAAAIMAAAGSSGILVAAANRPWCDLSRFSGPDLLNRHFHEQVPPDALFMPSYYPVFFNHMYYREVERRRPDVTMVHQSMFSRFDSGRGYALDMTRRHPETGPLFAEFLATGFFPAGALEEAARHREVLLENDTLEVTSPDSRFHPFSLGEGGLPLPAPLLRFAGAGLLFGPAGALRPAQGAPAAPAGRPAGAPCPRGEAIGSASEGEEQHSFWSEFYREMAATTPMHPELAKLLLWFHYRNALFFINRGDGAAALLEVRMARKLEPGAARLMELEGLLSD